ncbi:MAG: hypothetical protein Kow009_02290 [Spirochaetales bacterium]
MIGLKLADGRFFPILEETERIAKRVVLTTVHEGQTQVKVDLYRGDVESESSSWEYIASLVLEHVHPASDGTPQLELILRLVDTSTLDARLRDEGSGESQSLRIDIESLEYGDFSLPDLDPLEGTNLEPQFPSIEENEVPPVKERPHLIPAMILFLFLCLLILGILVYIIFTATKGSPPPSLAAEYLFDFKPYNLPV